MMANKLKATMDSFGSDMRNVQAKVIVLAGKAAFVEAIANLAKNSLGIAFQDGLSVDIQKLYLEGIFEGHKAFLYHMRVHARELIDPREVNQTLSPATMETSRTPLKR
jgi:hypothetical protein